MTAEVPSGVYETLPNTEIKDAIDRNRIIDFSCLAPELVEKYRPRFWEVVETAMQTCITAHEQRAMMLMAQNLEYMYFGQRGEEPPPGRFSVLGVHNIDTGDSTLISLIPDFTVECERDASARLRTLGMRELEGDIDAEDRGWEFFKPEVVKMIWNSPARQLLESFGSQLIEAPGDQPLSLFHRQVKEVQITQEISRQFCVNGDILPHTVAYHALRRALRQLDDETELQKVDNKTDNRTAIERAKSYFRPYIAAALPVYEGEDARLCDMKEGSAIWFHETDPDKTLIEKNIQWSLCLTAADHVIRSIGGTRIHY